MMKLNFFDGSEEKENEVAQKEEAQEEGRKEIRQKHFAVWTVGGESYRLKLQTAGVKELEARYKGSIMSLMQNGDGIPPLTVMLDVAHVAMKPWNHKITQKDMERMFDAYEEEGGDLLSFFTNVYLEIFMVSGFLSKRVAAEMATSLEDMRKEL